MKCWIGNLDGDRQAMIIANNQVVAAQHVGGLTNLREFSRWFRYRKITNRSSCTHDYCAMSDS